MRLTGLANPHRQFRICWFARHGYMDCGAAVFVSTVDARYPTVRSQGLMESTQRLMSMLSLYNESALAANDLADKDKPASAGTSRQ